MRLYWLCSLLFVLASGVLFGSPFQGAMSPAERAAPVAVLALYDAASAFDVPRAPCEDAEVADAEEGTGAGIADEDETSGADGEAIGDPGAPGVIAAPDRRAVSAPFMRLQARPGHPRGREHPPRV